MSVFADVLSSLRSMTQLQLLLAFLACTGYVLAQGGLIGLRGRRVAWSVTLISALGFAFESTEWMHAAMLATFAIPLFVVDFLEFRRDEEYLGERAPLAMRVAVVALMCLVTLLLAAPENSAFIYFQF